MGVAEGALEPYVDDGDFRLYAGDVRGVLRALPETSVHCVVTSPPYFGLRSYGGDAQIWGGDDGCDHQWGERLPEHHPGQVEQTKWKSAEAAGKGQTAGAGQFCVRCGAWYGDLGLEPTPEMYVQHLTEIFREMRRVLRDDGTFWLNIGDSYSSGGREGHGTRAGAKQGTNRASALGLDAVRAPQPDGIKPKDLMGIPWMLAFALRADGWYLRSEIIWAKGASFLDSWSGSVMPESVQDRPTKAHEQMFLLTKRPSYFYDIDAVREEAKWERWGDQTVPKYEGTQTASGWMKPKTREELNANRSSYKPGSASNMNDGEHVAKSDAGLPLNPAGRNLRSVWAISTESYSGAHFAVMPTALVVPCIKAGTSEEGCCSVCGAPWVRDVEYGESDYARLRGERDWKALQEQQAERGADQDGRTGKHALTDAGTVPSLRARDTEQRGWKPSCQCYTRDDPDQARVHADSLAANEARHSRGVGEPVPCVVLDPFMGSGTTAFVARNLGRHSVGIELNEAYAKLAADRMQQQSLFA